MVTCPLQQVLGHFRTGFWNGARGFPTFPWRSPRGLSVVWLGAAGLLCGKGTPTVHPVNSLFVIVPYKYEGMWVFDDPRVGLSREPFIAGIDTMIDKLVAKIPDAGRGFRAVFSAGPFPGYTETIYVQVEPKG